eukprot:CAMPEP_0113600464 /NCGR_PEP_ID=MMETSP0015_2-20120614/42717_1 /TAXON_ID=2838 /ORGANISM="Odontella" /LENGTH=152 /DNA_ID=CAMNT_0000508715 /DNA_START=190 /DNA_END=650 /DNA_ORIENTATION=+ /assembly_acc=CAM_ASM_000160
MSNGGVCQRHSQPAVAAARISSGVGGDRKTCCNPFPAHIYSTHYLPPLPVSGEAPASNATFCRRYGQGGGEISLMDINVQGVFPMQPSAAGMEGGGEISLMDINVQGVFPVKDTRESRNVWFNSVQRGAGVGNVGISRISICECSCCGDGNG